jgi:hypothetical protein
MSFSYTRVFCFHVLHYRNIPKGPEGQRCRRITHKSPGTGDWLDWSSKNKVPLTPDDASVKPGCRFRTSGSLRGGLLHEYTVHTYMYILPQSLKECTSIFVLLSLLCCMLFLHSSIMHSWPRASKSARPFLCSNSILPPSKVDITKNFV